MDLVGLFAEELRVLYDPSSLEIHSTAVGSAIAFDPVYPPTVTVSPERGEIILRSTEPTQPLRFISGGEIMQLTVSSTNPGDGYLVIDNLILRSEDGRRVPATISGGRAKVQYR
jgi:hypothetical protein